MMDAQAVRQVRMDEMRIQRAADYKEERDRWVELARFAMENARRAARAWAEFLELTPEDETP